VTPGHVILLALTPDIGACGGLRGGRAVVLVVTFFGG
jgi:hypothetical protein